MESIKYHLFNNIVKKTHLHEPTKTSKTLLYITLFDIFKDRQKCYTEDKMKDQGKF